MQYGRKYIPCPWKTGLGERASALQPHTHSLPIDDSLAQRVLSLKQRQYTSVSTLAFKHHHKRALLGLDRLELQGFLSKPSSFMAGPHKLAPIAKARINLSTLIPSHNQELEVIQNPHQHD